ncbi:acetyltransferase (GNAT) family protein [Cellulophaga sp. RHA19]|uniref:GNAT family N-acetyltransferase n=1 Tax=Cellulophaga sp. RHA19 TaxID=1798237 RepID=UPI000C2BE227|nr:GNAT family N-acetyltransferase [Cellulophaga sp. RHA19]PKB44491.1 acetyltransferase (GNAT) family protein [Cellulophaga sp. RHA19]
MKKEQNLINSNLNNLISLWRTVGVAFGSYKRELNFEYCEIKDSEWPNRLWLQQNITQGIVDELKIKLTTISKNITVPLWNIYDKDDDTILIRNGFRLKFEQVGMFLKVNKSFVINNNVKIKQVTSINDTKLWSTIFAKSFGYKISPITIQETLKNIIYYIAYKDGVAVGTAMLYKTNNVMGIHSVGIPPEMRRKGFAESIMKLLINKSIEYKVEYITLQASSMGKNLYLKLGFKDQFVIKNYILDQNVTKL